MNETPPPPAPAALPQQKTSGLAIWSLVLGILGLICFSIFTAIPGVICGHTALSRIKGSGGILAGKGLAIAGLVTGYLGILWAVVFIPMLLAIAIPNFVKARHVAQTNMCLNNLRTIDAAKQQWAAEHANNEQAVPTQTDLDQYIPNGFSSLKCAGGGTYTINAMGTPPTCSIAEHQLSDQQNR